VRRLVLPDDVKVTLLAGFADTKLFGFLDELGFDYVIRLKGNTKISAADGTTRPAAEGQGGRARKLRDATEAQCPVGVCVQAKGMKEAWCLAASNAAAPSRQIIDLYAKRWGVEPSFRDTKDLRFGLSSVRISDPQRRGCCSMPLPLFCSPCSAPPARASA
jgi:DDE family transposase